MREAEGAHPGGVDNPPALGQSQHQSRSRCVPAATGHRVDVTRGAIGTRDKGIDERRLAYAGVAHQHGRAVGEVITDGLQVGVARTLALSARDRNRDDIECGVGIDERRRIGKVRLRDDEEWLDAGVDGGDEGAVDEAQARLGVHRGDDDGQLVGVGHDDALDGIVVVRGAPQHGRPLVHADDAPE